MGKSRLNHEPVYIMVLLQMSPQKFQVESGQTSLSSLNKEESRPVIFFLPSNEATKRMDSASE